MTKEDINILCCMYARKILMPDDYFHYHICELLSKDEYNKNEILFRKRYDRLYKEFEKKTASQQKKSFQDYRYLWKLMKCG